MLAVQRLQSPVFEILGGSFPFGDELLILADEAAVNLFADVFPPEEDNGNAISVFYSIENENAAEEAGLIFPQITPLYFLPHDFLDLYTIAPSAGDPSEAEQPQEVHSSAEYFALKPFYQPTELPESDRLEFRSTADITPILFPLLPIIFVPPESKDNAPSFITATSTNDHFSAEIIPVREPQPPPVPPSVPPPQPEPRNLPAQFDFNLPGLSPDKAVRTPEVDEGFIFHGAETGSYTGMTITAIGDINGDGRIDFAFGAPKNDVRTQDTGLSYIIYGREGGFSPEISLATLTPDQGAVIAGGDWEFSGQSIIGLGDMNGDHIDDFLITSWNANGVGDAQTGIGTRAGGAYLIYGQAGGLPGFSRLPELVQQGQAVFFANSESFALNGWSASALGDINGDGVMDFALGAVAADSGGTPDTGAAYIIFGKNNGRFTGMEDGVRDDIPNNGRLDDRVFNLNTLNGQNGFRINGAVTGTELGGKITSLGDINGDGLSDILIAGQKHNEAYVIYGRANNSGSLDISSLRQHPELGFVISGGSNRLGISVAGGVRARSTTADTATSDAHGAHLIMTGDLNGDGRPDFALGDTNAAALSGAAYVIFGGMGNHSSGIIDVRNLDGANGFRVFGQNPGDSLGSAISFIGDINGDGVDDLAIGAARANNDRGTVYVIYGKESGFDKDFDLASLDGGNGFRVDGWTNSRLGSALGAADVNSDGTPDLLIGALRDQVNGPLAGGVLALYGSAIQSHMQTGTQGNDVIQGNDQADLLLGRQGDDQLFGHRGNDVLDGGLGADSLDGGEGDDLYIVDNIGDVIIEDHGRTGGNDTVRSAVDFTLSIHTENLELTGSARTGIGNAGANRITGNGAANILVGNGGADIIDGGNGNDRIEVSGIDFTKIVGGNGIDTLVLHAPPGSDKITLDLGQTENPIDILKIESIEYVDLDQNNLKLNWKSVWSIAGTRDLHIENGTLILTDAPAWAYIGSTQDATGLIDIYRAGDVQIHLAQTVERIGLAPLIERHIYQPAPIISLEEINHSLRGSIISTSQEGAHTGTAITAVGDVNGDGIDDFMIGAQSADSPGLRLTGNAYLIYGQAGGLPNINLANLTAEQGVRFTFNQSGAQLGAALAHATDVNGDDLADFVFGISELRNPISGANTGGAVVLYGREGGFQGTIDLSRIDATTGAIFYGEQALSNTGNGAAALDFDGDGYTDLVFGNYWANSNIPGGAALGGTAYVVYGGPDGFSHDGNYQWQLGQLSSVGARFGGAEQGERLGQHVASIGDLDGDGINELMLGSPQADHNGQRSGSAYIIFGGQKDAAGQPLRLTGDFDTNDIGNTIQGFRIDGQFTRYVGGRLGSSATSLDLNGDGHTDLVLSADRNSRHAPNGDGTNYEISQAGGVYVIFGGRQLANLRDHPAHFSVDQIYATEGEAVQHDGYWGVKIVGAHFHDNIGASLAKIGDFNGDGLEDLLIGGNYSNNAYKGAIIPEGGAAYLIYGRHDWSEHIDLASLRADQGFRLDGELPFGWAGHTVAGLGDINHDGFDDIAIGRTDQSDSPITGQGAVYILYGGQNIASQNFNPLPQHGFAAEVTRATLNDTILDANPLAEEVDLAKLADLSTMAALEKEIPSTELQIGLKIHGVKISDLPFETNPDHDLSEIPAFLNEDQNLNGSFILSEPKVQILGADAFTFTANNDATRHEVDIAPSPLL